MITADCQQELETLVNRYTEEHGYAPSFVGARIGDAYTVIHTEVWNTGRWSRYDLVVVRGPLGSLWGFIDESGLTELQEVEPGPCEVFPVEAHATVAYRRAEA